VLRVAPPAIDDCVATVGADCKGDAGERGDNERGDNVRGDDSSALLGAAPVLARCKPGIC
jgi:hypothetical protein